MGTTVTSSNLYNNRVVEKINGMAFNPTITLKCIH
jgi:hypothetical protein